jgi:hypothetical protein
MRLCPSCCLLQPLQQLLLDWAVQQLLLLDCPSQTRQ